MIQTPFTKLTRNFRLTEGIQRGGICVVMRQTWLFMARRIVNIDRIADIVVYIGKVS